MVLRILSHSNPYCVACCSPRRGVQSFEQRGELSLPQFMRFPLCYTWRYKSHKKQIRLVRWKLEPGCQASHSYPRSAFIPYIQDSQTGEADMLVQMGCWFSKMSTMWQYNGTWVPTLLWPLRSATKLAWFWWCWGYLCRLGRTRPG